METAFGELNFDPKAWVNEACQNCPSDESLERHLGEMEMKLNLLAEDVDQALEEHASDGLAQAPRALEEIDQMEKGSKDLAERVLHLVERIQREEAECEAATGLLRDMDRAKANIEGAIQAVEQASSLTHLLETIESALQERDFSQAAAALASANSSIRALGEMPGFDQNKRWFEDLDSRLQSGLVPEANEALREGDSNRCAKLREALSKIGKMDILADAYPSAREPGLVASLEESTSAAVGASARSEQEHPEVASERLTEWQRSVADALESDMEFAKAAFPNEASWLCSRLCRDILARASTKCKKLAMTSSSGDTESAAKLNEASCRFAYRLSSLLGCVDGAEDAIRLAVAPLEDLKSQYGEMERQKLSSTLRSRCIPAEDLRLESAADALSECLQEAFQQMQAAVGRCFRLTGGTEAEAFLKALDESYLQLLHNLLSSINSLKTSLGLFDSEVATIHIGEEGVQGALKLLAVGWDLGKRQHAFEASLRHRLNQQGQGTLRGAVELAERQQRPTPKELGENPTVVRLVDLPNKLKKARGLVDQASDARFACLPRSAPKGSAVEEALRALAKDALFSRPASLLSGIEEAHMWQEGGETSFHSAYPDRFATELGEYLLMLPQQLEALPGTADDEAEDDPSSSPSSMATSAIKETASAASSRAAERFLRISQLSDRGLAQLAADVEYLVNVNTALGAETPRELSSLLQLLQAPADGFSDACAGDDVDSSVAAAVSSMRGLQ